MKKDSQIEYIKIPRELAETAESRCKAIVRRWSLNYRNTLEELATSLYLQGIQDCITVQGALDEKLPPNPSLQGENK